MIANEWLCDVCGAHATYHASGMTGRVLFDGYDRGQDVDLCDEHKPDPNYRWQPRNTTRMIFYWPGRFGENQYPPRG
jgi:hypothetical protein